jgi:hypothetical protein
MKNILILFLFIALNNYAQHYDGHVYYGIPTDYEINRGDIVIMNLPSFKDGKFLEDTLNGDLENLKNLLIKNNELKYEIFIHFNLGAKKYNDKLSEELRLSLKEIFKKDKRMAQSKIEITPMGSSLNLVKEDVDKSKLFNTRLEIRVEQAQDQTTNTNFGTIEDNFIGGRSEFVNIFFSKVEYPEELKAEKLSKTVYFRIEIDTTGLIVNFKIVRGGHPLMDKEVEEKIYLTNGKWKPMSKDGEMINYFINEKVYFRGSR